VAAEDEYVGTLLRVLDEEPRLPSTVDVARALAEGRRRRRTRKVRTYCGGAAAVVLLVVAGGFAVLGVPPAGGDQRTAQSVPPSATPTAEASPSAPASTPAGPDEAGAPSSCEVSRLAVPDGRVKSIVTGADPSGRYIAGRSYHAGTGGRLLKVWLWDRGKATQVPLPGEDQLLSDVNTHGVAVGTSYEADGPHPYLYRDGVVTRLPGVRTGAAVAINDAGVIAGNDLTTNTPVIWRSPTEPPVALPVPSGGAGITEAADLAEDGTVVGRAAERAYVWAPNGTGGFLATPDGMRSGAAIAIRGPWVIGEVGALAGLRWDLRTGDVDEVTQFDGRPQAVNERGWLTGFDRKGRGALVIGARIVIMNDLFEHRAGGFTNMPKTLSDDGSTVAGQAYDRIVGDVVAVRWQCT
jgi:hypothetical protein